MSHRLRDHVNSQYFEAANRMTSKKARRKIVAYVESYDDILFWRTVLGRFEDDTRYFEIMLPTRASYLERGKKAAVAQLLTAVGRDMIACVDADYDYLMQGKSSTSAAILDNPYIFHTYVYAIENYQSYAPGLHDACVMVTLNDHRVFDFEEYLYAYSRCVYPLFVWSVWFYRGPHFREFTITDLNKMIEPGYARLNNTADMIDFMRKKIKRKELWLKRHYPQFEDDRPALEKELQQLGVVPDNTYLYLQGHHLFNNVVVPIVTRVCEQLIRERQNEIRSTSMHTAQEQTELSCYTHSVGEVTAMLKKNTVYQYSDQFQQLLADVAHFLEC